MLDSPVTLWVLGFAALIGALAVIGRLLLVLWRFSRKVGLFFEDWFGTPARPGFPAQPGTMERVGKLESGQREIRDQLQRIEPRPAH
jgi:hypothetical protein